MGLYNRECKLCGVSFVGGPRSWYCPNCRKERQRQRKSIDNYKQKYGLTRKLGSTDVCEFCGKAYIVYGGLQKYCPNCAPIAVKEIDRKQGLVYYQKNNDDINLKRHIKRHPGITRNCVVCGKQFIARTCTITCSEECRRLHKNEWYRNYSKKNKGKE